MNLYRITNSGRMFFNTIDATRRRKFDGIVEIGEIVAVLYESIHYSYYEMVVLTQFHGIGFIVAPVRDPDAWMEKI